jgi:hypothetical protein
MSKRNVMSVVSTAFSFTSDKVAENLLSLVSREKFELTEEQKRKMVSIIKGSVEQAFSLTSDSIEKELNK